MFSSSRDRKAVVAIQCDRAIPGLLRTLRALAMTALCITAVALALPARANQHIRTGQGDGQALPRAAAGTVTSTAIKML